MDPLHSHFGPLAPPQAFDRMIKQSPNQIHSLTHQAEQHGDSHTNVIYSIDGKENVVSLHGDQARITAKWMMSNLIAPAGRWRPEYSNRWHRRWCPGSIPNPPAQTRWRQTAKQG